ncbi:hypothetical protein [Leifsonia sp. 1010]|uniref:hypothetical protein n=1 Tax=Leifsonia sp. 1010 TaxID=2817769 RepID=UPI002864111A|nr:hypothetical protein [Leifsonia sp. 1010]MDR6613731.1 hypothetical protein [Leifsonia sp. 1010]
MMIEEFVDFRVRAGEAVREERQREQARRVDERGRWLRAERRGRRGARSTDVAGGAGTLDAVVPVPAPAAESLNDERRELADVAR